MSILSEQGGYSFRYASFKRNYFYDHFTYWQIILQFTFPAFPLDNMHNVQ